MQLGAYPDPTVCKVDYRAMLKTVTEAGEVMLPKDTALQESFVENVSISCVSRLGITPNRDHRHSFLSGILRGRSRQL
jgi:hypothetical protein